MKALDISTMFSRVTADSIRKDIDNKMFSDEAAKRAMTLEDRLSPPEGSTP